MHGTKIKIMSVVEGMIADVLFIYLLIYLFIYYLMGILITYAEVKVSDNLKVIILVCKYFYFGHCFAFLHHISLNDSK